jgi:hypothetical protein
MDHLLYLDPSRQRRSRAEAQLRAEGQNTKHGTGNTTRCECSEAISRARLGARGTTQNIENISVIIIIIIIIIVANIIF